MIRAWLLNFDADEELARPEGPRKLPTSRALSCRLLRARALLVPRGEPLLDEASVPVDQIVTWMPTRRALALLRARGLPVPAAPAFEILRQVNSRRFSAELGAGPPGTCWMTDEAQIARRLAGEGEWLLRTAHGFAGRGRQLARGGVESNDDVLRFVRAALARDGGLEMAPRVEIVLELAMHGFVGRDGSVTLGVPTRSHVDAQGQWRRTSLITSELDTNEASALASAAEHTAHALFAARYFGPFGIDAFRYRTRHGVAFCPRSEINARYTMAWGRGMSGRRVDLC